MTQKPIIRQLLPLTIDSFDDADTEKQTGHWDYIYEPDSAKEIIG